MVYRIRSLVLIGLLGAGISLAVYAQPALEVGPSADNRPFDNPKTEGALDPQPQQEAEQAEHLTGFETLTVTGTLTIIQGWIAVQENGVTYYVPGLERYSRFIDDLKYGAEVTLEGFGFPYPPDKTIKVLRAAKLTLNGKEYDLTPPTRGRRFHRQIYRMGP
jgi:hypothetical protein